MNFSQPPPPCPHPPPAPVVLSSAACRTQKTSGFSLLLFHPPDRISSSRQSRCWHRQQPTIPRVNQSCFLFLSKVPPVGLERQLTFAIENSRNGVSRFRENDGNGNAGPKNALGHALRCVPLNFFCYFKKKFLHQVIDAHWFAYKKKKSADSLPKLRPPNQMDPLQKLKWRTNFFVCDLGRASQSAHLFFLFFLNETH